MNFPLENTCFCSGGFCLWNVTGLLERYREGGVGQGIVRRESRECQRSPDRLFQTSSIAQRADKAVMCFEVVRIRSDRIAKVLNSGHWIAGRELIQAPLCVRFCCGFVQFGHEYL